MEFDRRKILTIATCEQAQVGQKGWFGDDADTLRCKTLNENPEELKYINDSSDLYPFGNENDCYAYFYPEESESVEAYASRQAEWVKENDINTERQSKWVKENDIREGDKVRVVRKADNYKDGWGNTWEYGIDPFIGKVYEVLKIKEEGIILNHKGCFLFPYFVLEKVKTSFRPFSSEELNKLVGKVVKLKAGESAGKRSLVTNVDCGKVVTGGNRLITALNLLEYYVLDDGTPCGVEEE